METFSGPREFEESPRYLQDRQSTLAALDLGSIDETIVVIDAGLGQGIEKWRPLQERIRRVTRVFTCNRAGSGQSKPGRVLAGFPCSLGMFWLLRSG